MDYGTRNVASARDVARAWIRARARARAKARAVVGIFHMDKNRFGIRTMSC